MLMPTVMPKEPGLVFLFLRVSCLLLAGELLNCWLYLQISSNVQCYSATSQWCGRDLGMDRRAMNIEGMMAEDTGKVCGHQEWVEQHPSESGDSQIPLCMLGTGVNGHQADKEASEDLEGSRGQIIFHFPCVLGMCKLHFIPKHLLEKGGEGG